MKKNMGGMDRVIRILIALTVAFLYWNGNISGTTAIIAGILAIIFVATSLISFCPLYLPFGIRTTKRE